jgi:hypothetical protein
MPATVAVLIIEHRHGRNVVVCADESVADRKLFEYVEREWAQEIPNKEAMPPDREQAVARYFDVMGSRGEGEEFYDIETRNVED